MLRRRVVGRLADDDPTVVVDPQRDVREEEAERELQPGARPAQARELTGAAHRLAALCGGQALDLVDAEPGREAGERVLGREVDVEVRGQRVERRRDRVEHLLEGLQEAHRERRRLIAPRHVVAAVDVRDALAQVLARRHRRRCAVERIGGDRAVGGELK